MQLWLLEWILLTTRSLTTLFGRMMESFLTFMRSYLIIGGMTGERSRFPGEKLRSTRDATSLHLINCGINVLLMTLLQRGHERLE